MPIGDTKLNVIHSLNSSTGGTSKGSKASRTCYVSGREKVNSSSFQGSALFLSQYSSHLFHKKKVLIHSFSTDIILGGDKPLKDL
jgi:hypothetical protein